MKDKRHQGRRNPCLYLDNTSLDLDWKLPTAQNWPITTNLRYLSFSINIITADLTNQFIRTRLKTSTEHKFSLDSDEESRRGCRNVNVSNWQHSYRTTHTRTIRLQDHRLKYITHFWFIARHSCQIYCILYHWETYTFLTLLEILWHQSDRFLWVVG